MSHNAPNWQAKLRTPTVFYSLFLRYFINPLNDDDLIDFINKRCWALLH